MQKETIKLFLQVALRTRAKLIIAAITSVATIAIGLFLGPYILSQFLNKIQSGQLGELSHNFGLIAAYLGTQIFGEIIGWRITLYCVWKFETQGQNHIAQKVFRHLTHQSANFHANRFAGSLVSQTNKIIGGFERFWDTVIFQLIPTITSIILAVSILSFIFWQYAVALLIISIVFVISVILGSKSMAPLNIREAQKNTAQTGRLADAMSNIVAIKADANEDYENQSFQNIADQWRKASLKTMRSFIRLSTGYASLIVTINTTALLLALWASNNNIINISIVYLSVTYTFTVVRHLWDINSIMRNYYRIMGDSHDMTEILLLPQEVQDTKAATKLKAVRGSIRFENVTFKHENKKTEKPLFNNLNITIKPGEKIGLVGHSGSGKTTLTKLILRFMDIQGGQITVDGQNIAEVTQQSLRKHIAYVSQEPLLFHRSLHENIAYGDLKSTEKEVKAVAKMANAHEFIDKLTDGYKTLVGERGIKLSGGQRQRVAIARAMLKNAPILILDEATSALDSESEALIQDALWKLMEGKTTIVIAHRLSTIQKMDRILVLDHGKVVEEGTHKELIRKNGIYSEFWDRQSGGFMNE